MKAALFTGMFILLLLAAPTQTYALGLAEYGQEAAKAEQPVLPLARLNDPLGCLKEWQTLMVAHPFREMVPLFFRVSQLLVAGALLVRYWLARRALHQLESDAHGQGLLSPQ